MKVNMIPKNASSFMPQNFGMAGPTVAPPLDPSQAQDQSVSFTSLDPLEAQRQYALNALQSGASMAPARGGIVEGIARLGQAIGGGMMAHNAQDQISSAKKSNLEALTKAFGNNDFISLLGSDDPVAQKLGSAVIEQKMKNDPGKIVTTDDGTVIWQSLHGGKPEVIRRPQRAISDGAGHISRDNGETWEDIPGFVASKKAISEATRKPGAAKPNDDGKAPWERKW